MLKVRGCKDFAKNLHFYYSEAVQISRNESLNTSPQFHCLMATNGGSLTFNRQFKINVSHLFCNYYISLIALKFWNMIT